MQSAQLQLFPKPSNRVRAEDKAIHEWYRFVLSYPPHLVRDYIGVFRLNADSRVLDPFCGTGTTLVEAKKLGVPSLGVEGNPMAILASRVKTSWDVDPSRLLAHANTVAEATLNVCREQGLENPCAAPPPAPFKLRSLDPALGKLLLKDCISPLPLHRTLILLDKLQALADPAVDSYERLALAKAIVFGISNLHFGPEVGVGPPKTDAPVVALWLENIRAIAEDLGQVQQSSATESHVLAGDARDLSQTIPDESIDAVITSPPYPNEKDYTRTTRLESVILGLVESKAALRALKKGLIRSNTRGVYQDDNDDRLVEHHVEINRIADAIEARRLELGKTSGFERLYPRVTRLYFGGMAKHLSGLRRKLRPGANLAYVVGDQASYLRVMIHTGQLIADLADSLGYEVVGIDLFRTRLATATKAQLREEVVRLRWPGD